MNFAYKALDKNGKQISGYVTADSQDQANAVIAQRGEMLLSIKESRLSSKKDRPLFSDLFSFVKPMDLILFTKQLKTLIKAGIPMLSILNTLHNQTENAHLKKVILQISKDIKEGRSIFRAFKKHPAVFSDLYCSMIYAGETSGSMPEVLDRLIYIIDHENKIRSEVKSAMTYPIIVVITLMMAFFVLLLFVIPKFEKIYAQAGVNLPLPTVICIRMNNFFVQYWMYYIPGLFGIVIFMFFWLKTENGTYMKDLVLLKIPLIGILFLKSAMSRFASIFSILQSSGIVVLESLSILAGTIGNAVITKEFKRISEELTEGRGIAGPLRKSKYFPPMIVDMVAVGEESGTLDELMDEASKHYDVEVEYAIKKLTDAIGPILTLGLAVVVGFFALAIYLPMWDLIKLVK
ncbi:MAG: type II secretion system F family protein [Proteobacteria bacterium]|nr:type II secretion system F family protein [Pseudomonadota bacterium]MBU1389547.1 type II secretion system F family protein [Pseudomonadota bacterium]MBU1544411.1 type II secretion system F family protein [Pseudomonadota bacterium]MBU2431156.1 type II secretion system F family protein [Pseudomonadota bacterium]MBU2480685.1 type II secretion system F family protein [Pseudomonadota bacterium]